MIKLHAVLLLNLVWNLCEHFFAPSSDYDFHSNISAVMNDADDIITRSLIAQNFFHFHHLLHLYMWIVFLMDILDL